jgi:GAF domain-containing protein
VRLLAAVALGAAACIAQAQERLESARTAARWVVQKLAEGDLHAVANVSNAPRERLKALADYQARVGPEEFKRIYARFLKHEIIDEYAVGPYHLVIWDLVEADGHLAGQYFVREGPAFMIDDRPSAAREQLRRLLQGYRKEKVAPQGAR